MRVLWDSDVPRTAHAAARAAFEAAQEVIFLGTRDADYDYFGARARAGELLDWEAGASLASQAAVDQGPVVQQPASVLAAKDAEVWGGFAPEKKELMGVALADVTHDRTKKKNRQFHWNGKARTKLPQEFAEATGGDKQTQLIHRSLYNLLSIHSHPAPKIEIKSLGFDGHGFTLHVDGDPVEVAGIAMAATEIALAWVTIVLKKKLSRYEDTKANE